MWQLKTHPQTCQQILSWVTTECRQVLPYIEILPVLGRFPIDQGWEKQDHVAAFVHDWGTTVGAADFAGEFVDACFLRRLVPAEIVVAVGEVDVVFVEDGGPLEGCACVKSQQAQQRQRGGGNGSRGGYAPCNFWHVEQWQYFESNGFSRLNWYFTFPQ